jgi:hypothetical protein
VFIKIVGIFLFGILSITAYAADSAVLKMTRILDVTLNETELTFLAENYQITLIKPGFYPSKVGCLSFNQLGMQISVAFINSWSQPDKIGRYTVSKTDKSNQCKVLSDAKISEIYLGYNQSQLINTFGDNFTLGTHDDDSYKEDGIFGQKYIKFSVQLPLKEVTFADPDDGIEKRILFESSVLVEFTFDDSGLVKQYFVGRYEEPSPD